MKQHLRQELKNVFDAPQPLHKRAFLRTLEQPKISIPAFILTQFGYIRRWVWIVSALVFVLAVALISLLRGGRAVAGYGLGGFRADAAAGADSRVGERTFTEL